MVQAKKGGCTAAVIVSGCLWGLTGFFRRRLDLMGLDTPGVVLVRFGITAILFAAAIALTDRSAIKLRWKDLWCFLGSGICSLLFFTLCYFQAMTLMSLSAAAVLLYTAPCFVMLISALLFGERVTWRKLAAMLLALCGCALVSGVAGSDARLSLAGILCGLGAGLGYALYSIFGKLAMARGYKSMTINFYSCLFAALGAGIIGGFSAPVSVMLSSGGDALFCLATSVLTCFLPYLLYTYGLSGIEAGKASILASVEPVVATAVGIIAFGETLDAGGAVGMLLVLSAIVLLVAGRRR